MANDKTPIKEVFSRLMEKLVDKNVLSPADVVYILDASDEDVKEALDELNRRYGKSIQCNQCKFFGEDSAGISGCTVTCKIVSGNDAACNNFRIKR